MTYRIEVNTHRVSYRNEDGEWMDGDRRELEPLHTEHVDMDTDDLEEYGTPLRWAVDYLNRRVWPEEASTSPLPEAVNERVRLSRATPHPYREETEEVSVYLTGAWTDVERGQVFRKALP